VLAPHPLRLDADRRAVLSAVVVGGTLVCVTITLLANAIPVEAAPFVAAFAVAVVARRSLVSWETLLVALVLVILLLPMRRYSISASLPFQPEPYRILAAFILTGWLASLLVDQRVRFRRSGLEAPIFLVAGAVVASIVVNGARVGVVETDVAKRVSFLASFFLVFFLIVSVVQRPSTVDAVVKALVAGGSCVAVFAFVEARTDYNVFNHLSGLVPFLREAELPEVPARGARLRVYSSAEHPIALGAVLVMMIPLALYLAARFRQRRWWVAGLLLAMGCLATVSRTAVVMLGVVVLVFLWLRPQETKRMWPALVPLVVVVHFALPGTLGSLKQAFLPEGGLIAEQRGAEGTSGAGRVADLEPTLEQWSRSPLVGRGFGTHIVDPKAGGSQQILDNQWLGILVETGVLGVIAWVWLFLRGVRRFGRAAKAEGSPVGLALAAISASLAAYAVGMFMYDAFAFAQVTFVMFVLLGLGAALLPHENARVVAFAPREPGGAPAPPRLERA
jgi:O-antigen ligase